MLDFLIDRLLNKRYITDKIAHSIATSLIEINKMVNGWLKSIKDNASKT